MSRNAQQDVFKSIRGIEQRTKAKVEGEALEVEYDRRVGTKGGGQRQGDSKHFLLQLMPLHKGGVPRIISG